MDLFYLKLGSQAFCAVLVLSQKNTIGGLPFRLSFSLALIWGALSTLATRLNETDHETWRLFDPKLCIGAGIGSLTFMIIYVIWVKFGEARSEFQKKISS